MSTKYEITDNMFKLNECDINSTYELIFWLRPYSA